MLMIKDFETEFGAIAGLSDHTMGTTVPVVATALGAKIIEKHFIIDRSVGGPDASFSLDKEEFSSMVKAVREAEKAIGKIDYSLTKSQLKSRDFSRSLYVVSDIRAGELISKENVKSIRPGFGISPKFLKDILGKKARVDLTKGTRFKLEYLSSDDIFYP